MPQNKRPLCLVLNLFFSLSLGLLILCQGETSQARSLLNWKEFSSLSRQDQIRYLEDWRRLALKMEEREAVVSTESKPSQRSGIELWSRLLLPKACAVPGQPCVFAGYVSVFNSRDKCEPPREMMSRNWTITTPSGGTVQQSFCPGQTLCNPLIYGFGKWDPTTGRYQAFCTSSASRPTADCERQYQSLPNYNGSHIAAQLLSSSVENDFNSQSQKMAEYCSGEGQTRQKSICDLMVKRSDFLKRKVETAKTDSNGNREALLARIPKADGEAAAVAPAPANREEERIEAAPVVADNRGDSAAITRGISDGNNDSSAAAVVPPVEERAAEEKPVVAAPPVEEKPEPKPELTPKECATKLEDAPAFLLNLPPAYRKFPLILGDLKEKMVMKIQSAGGKIQLAGFHPQKGYQEDYVKKICFKNGLITTTFANGKTVPIQIRNGRLVYVHKVLFMSLEFNMAPISESQFSQTIRGNGGSFRPASGSQQ